MEVCTTKHPFPLSKHNNLRTIKFMDSYQKDLFEDKFIALNSREGPLGLFSSALKASPPTSYLFVVGIVRPDTSNFAQQKEQLNKSFLRKVTQLLKAETKPKFQILYGLYFLDLELSSVKDTALNHFFVSKETAPSYFGKTFADRIIFHYRNCQE